MPILNTRLNSVPGLKVLAVLKETAYRDGHMHQEEFLKLFFKASLFSHFIQYSWLTNGGEEKDKEKSAPGPYASQILI